MRHHSGLAISASLCFTRCEASIENIWSPVRDLAVECGWRLEQLSGAHTKRACADQFLARLLTHCWLVVSHKKTMFFRRMAELRSEVPPEGRRSHDLRPSRRGNGGQQAVSWYAVMDVKNMPTRRWHQCRGFLGLHKIISSRAEGRPPRPVQPFPRSWQQRKFLTRLCQPSGSDFLCHVIGLLRTRRAHLR